MAKQSGLGDRAFVDGWNVSGATQQLGRAGGGPAALDMTSIDQSGYERQGGVRDGEISWTSFFDDTVSHPTLKLLPTADRIVTYCRGAAIGSAAASCVAKQVNYDGNRGTSGDLTLAVQTLADGFGVEWGELLTAGVRTDTAATNGTALDSGVVSTAFGLQAYLHVLAVTGTSVTVKLQDSADNTTFADVAGAAFTAVTPAGSPQAQRIAVAGTVRRYVRAVTTGTFSNAQFVVVLVRNATAVVF